MPQPADKEPRRPAGTDETGPTHVAMVIQRFRPAFTGQGVQVEQLCRHLARRGVESTVLTAVRRRPGGVEECPGYRIRRLRCDLPGVPSTARWNWFWMPVFGLRVFAALSAMGNRLDVVHVHALTDGLVGARAFGRRQHVPVIQEMTLLGDDDPASVRARDHRLSGLRWRAYTGCDAFVAMSEALADAYRRSGLPEDRLHVIPQGVDTERFRPPIDGAEARGLRAALGITTDGPVLAFVGSLIRRKGVDSLLRAWPRIRTSHPDAALLLAGRDSFPEDPDAEAALHEMTSRLPDEARATIHRLGLREDVHRVLRAADVFVFPSRREGFGSVIIEAMATGLPCVVAELPGITDRIFASPAGARDDPGRADGMVVPRDDPDALAVAVTRLLDAPEVARSVGRRARQRARARFDFEHVTDRYVQLYRQLGADA